MKRYLIKEEVQIPNTWRKKVLYRYIPSDPVGEESTCNAGGTGDVGLITGLGRFPGRGNGNPLQCSCLENCMDWGAWKATLHGVAKSQTQLCS